MNQESNIQHLQSPYKGLVPYDITDKDNFFGREREKQILLGKIFSYNVTLLFAGTGVGKSSLLRAAVMPVLTEKHHLDVIYYADWVRDSLEGLKEEIQKTLVDNEKISGRELKGIEELQPFLETCTAYSSEPLVLILDQFEELFRYHTQSGRLSTFVDQIVRVINDKELAISVVFAIREDFLAELNVFKGRIPGLFDNYYRLERLRESQARDAIEHPVARIGFHYEQGLVDQILQDLTKREQASQSRISTLKQSDEKQEYFVEPPYLQIVCQKLWEEDRERLDKTLTRKTYEELEGTEKIVQEHVESVMNELTLQEQALAFQMFQYLVTGRGTKMAYRDEDLADALKVSVEEIQPVLEHLEKVRILRRDNRPDGLWYELYHDVFAEIIRGWTKQFQKDEDRHIYSHITEATRGWEQQGRDDGDLLKGGLLLQARDWAQDKAHVKALYSEEQKFLALSLRKYYRGLWIRLGIVVAIVLFAIIAAIGGFYANEKRKEAENALKRAGQAEEKAKRQLVRNYWINGINARDKDNDPLKASHYFMQTASLTDDPVFSKNAQLAGDVLTRGAYLEAILEHTAPVIGAVFSGDESRILTWSRDHTARVWDLQTDEDFPREHLILQLEVQTGTQLDDVEEIQLLSSQKWQEKRHQYEKIAREHLKTGKYPRPNLFLNRLMTRPESCDRPGDWLQEVKPNVVSEAASKYARICLNRGNFSLEHKEYDQALRAFETALQLQTDSSSPNSRQLAEAYERIACTLIESGQNVDKSIEYAQKSMELDPYQQPDLALHMLALGYSQQGQNLEAAKAYLNLGRAYTRWKDYVSAVEVYQQAVELHPELEENIRSEYAEALYGLARNTLKEKKIRRGCAGNSASRAIRA